MATIIHPIFEECKKYTLDPFWKEKFSNFACNRFPPGARYDANHKNMILKINGKTEVIALSDDATYVFQVMLNILREKFGMQSTRDIEFQKGEMENNVRNNTIEIDCEWKKIKPKHIKDQLVMDYIIHLKEKYKLTQPEVRNLISIIQLGFEFKSLTQDNVIFKNGRVKIIEGLEFDKSTRTFSTPKITSIISRPTEKVSSTDKFCTALKKFLRDDNLRMNKFKS